MSHRNVQFLFVSMIIVSCTRAAVNAQTIRAVTIVTRHGDRAPQSSYPLDPHRDYEWPGGYGALSPKGIQQLYKSGTIKRQRFGALLKENNGLYSTENIHVRSSAVERCLVSGQSFLAGFLPPPENRNILPVRWQPVPIHSEPPTNDYLIAQSKVCPSYDISLRKSLNINGPDIDRLIAKDKRFFKSLEKNTGVLIKSLWDVFLIVDTLKVQKDNGLVLPTWAEPIYESILNPLKNITYKRYGQSKVTKIKGGALLNDILINLENFTKGSKQNVFIYSGHDITLSSLLTVLGAVDQTAVSPEYAAAITVELHANVAIKNDLEIKFFYFRNESDENPIQIILPNCSAPCSLGKFIDVIQPKLVTNYDYKCSEKTN